MSDKLDISEIESALEVVTPKTVQKFSERLRMTMHVQDNAKQWLCQLIAEVKGKDKRIAELEGQKDGAYSERNKVLSGMCSMAIALGYGVYVMPHEGAEWDDDWRNIVVIEGPTGQMSWHIHDSEMELFRGLPHASENKWDGHDTDEKYRRVVGMSECVPAMKTHRLNDASKRIAELEAELAEAKKDSERLDKLLNLTDLEDSDGNWAVILEWNNYQDFVQIRQLDGTLLIRVISEAGDFPDDMDYGDIPNAMFRKAIDRFEW